MSEPRREDEMRAVVRDILRELVPETSNGHSNGNGNVNGRANGNGDGRQPSTTADSTVVPQVPAPPTPAVLRPSTWNQPPAPGEVIGNASPAAPSASASAPIPAPASPAKPHQRSHSLRAAFTESDFKPSAPAAPPSAPAQHGAPATAGDEREELVTLDSDDDLEQFIRQLMSRLENPRERLAVRTGRLRFRLRRTAGAVQSGVRPAAATRIERGAVTERMIQAAAAEGTRLVLAPGAVLTPLAREQARARGVQIERERRC